MGSLKLHEEIKQLIVEDPGKIGLEMEKIDKIRLEVPIRGEKGNMLAQPDIVFRTKKGKQIFVEVKSGCNKKARQRLYFQMLRLKKFIKRDNLAAEVIGVYPGKAGLIIVG